MTKPLLSSEWISRLGEYGKLIVGFSGGLDSTVLLHALASHTSLRTRLVAVHVNHGISKHAMHWQKHCELFCHNLGVNYIAEAVTFDRSANIEEGARVARYAVFCSLMTADDCLVLAHHQDDQAETVLLQLFRGAGVDGMAAMTEVNRLGAGVLVRPFLSQSRKELEFYAATHGLDWVEDESNEDITYSRNYLRQKVVPLLTEQWSGVVGALSRTAIHCQQAKANLDELAVIDCPELLSPKSSLVITSLTALSFDRLINVLRSWLKKNQIRLPSTLTLQRIVHEVIQASPDAMPLVAWSDIQVRRYNESLYLDKKEKIKLPSHVDWTDFPKPLVLVDKFVNLSAVESTHGLMVLKNAKIQVRFRQGGEELYWHGQTKQLKKLLQEWDIPPWLRDRIPLIYVNNQLAAVVGYAVSDLFYSKESTGFTLKLLNGENSFILDSAVFEFIDRT